MPLIFLVLARLTVAYAQDVSVHENLHTTASAHSVSGGTFTGSGWRVDDGNSELYWDFGTQLSKGDISIVIDDIAWANLQGANNHLFELFSEGGHSSDNRAINLRLYGYGDSDEYGEWGDLKLLGWDRTTDPSTDLVAEQRYYGIDWDGNPHTWRITWDPTDFVLYRDGAELIHMDVTGIDLRVRYLWIPLQDWGGDYSAPIGTVYSNLDFEGWEPGDEPDDPPVPDDGDATTFTPIEDVTAASWEAAQTYSESDDLCVEAGASVAYTMFDLSSVSGTVTKAILVLHARDVAEAAGDGGEVYAVSDTSWTEDTLVWNNRPALGTAYGSFPAVNSGDTIEVDVTGAVQAGGRVALALSMSAANSVHFSSKEDGDGSGAPMLRVTVDNSSTGDDGDTDDSDTDDGGSDDGGSDDGGSDDGGSDDGGSDDGGRDSKSRGDASNAPGETSDMASACACDAGASGVGWVASVVAIAMVRRRPQRQSSGGNLRHPV